MNIKNNFSNKKKIMNNESNSYNNLEEQLYLLEQENINIKEYNNKLEEKIVCQANRLRDLEETNRKLKLNKSYKDLKIDNKLNELEYSKYKIENKLNQLNSLSNSTNCSTIKREEFISNFNNANSTRKNNENIKIFPHCSEIEYSIDEIYNKYNEIYIVYNNLIDEKEELSYLLREEIILNNELDNYINILKETLTNLTKKENVTYINGKEISLYQYLVNQKNNYDENCNEIDVLVDVNNLLKKIDYLKKANKNIESQLKSKSIEFISLSNDLNVLKQFKEDITVNLTAGLEQIEEFKILFKEIDNQNNFLINENNSLIYQLRKYDKNYETYNTQKPIINNLKQSLDLLNINFSKDLNNSKRSIKPNDNSNHKYIDSSIDSKNKYLTDNRYNNNYETIEPTNNKYDNSDNSDNTNLKNNLDNTNNLNSNMNYYYNKGSYIKSSDNNADVINNKYNNNLKENYNTNFKDNNEYSIDLKRYSNENIFKNNYNFSILSNTIKEYTDLKYRSLFTIENNSFFILNNSSKYDYINEINNKNKELSMLKYELEDTKFLLNEIRNNNFNQIKDYNVNKYSNNNIKQTNNNYNKIDEGNFKHSNYCNCSNTYKNKLLELENIIYSPLLVTIPNILNSIFNSKIFLNNSYNEFNLNKYNRIIQIINDIKSNFNYNIIDNTDNLIYLFDTFNELSNDIDYVLSQFNYNIDYKNKTNISSTCYNKELNISYDNNRHNTEFNKNLLITNDYNELINIINSYDKMYISLITKLKYLNENNKLLNNSNTELSKKVIELETNCKIFNNKNNLLEKEIKNNSDNLIDKNILNQKTFEIFTDLFIIIKNSFSKINEKIEQNYTTSINDYSNKFIRDATTNIIDCINNCSLKLKYLYDSFNISDFNNYNINNTVENENKSILKQLLLLFNNLVNKIINEYGHINKKINCSSNCNSNTEDINKVKYYIHNNMENINNNKSCISVNKHITIANSLINNLEFVNTFYNNLLDNQNNSKNSLDIKNFDANFNQNINKAKDFIKDLLTIINKLNIHDYKFIYEYSEQIIKILDFVSNNLHNIKVYLDNFYKTNISIKPSTNNNSNNNMLTNLAYTYLEKLINMFVFKINSNELNNYVNCYYVDINNIMIYENEIRRLKYLVFKKKDNNTVKISDNINEKIAKNEKILKDSENKLNDIYDLINKIL